jgi:protein involved in polysaccharide export with SLBB domain
MTKFKHIAYGIVSILFLNSCSEILEPISFSTGKKGLEVNSIQEEFEINIKGLTFKTAKMANETPYLRKVMLTGSGTKAMVLNETDFLKSSFPKSSNSKSYLLGIGDGLSFVQLNEFEAKTAQWPAISRQAEYLLGAGDVLTFTQTFESSKEIVFEDGSVSSLSDSKVDELITTQGVIGSNGSILLLGLGKIVAAKRTLDDVRTEVRNILIRNGQAPNFQLEINDFQSQKAFITIKDKNSKFIRLNNLPISLKEVVLEAGLSEADGNFALIKFTRNAKEFRVTAGQLFDLAAPEVFLQDKDQIEIQFVSNRETITKLTVGSKGNILFPTVGSIKVVNRSIDDLHKQISNIFIERGIKPNFQLELTKFASKKAYLIQKDVGSIVVPLTNRAITLRELILENKSSVLSNVSLPIISLKRNGQTFRMTSEKILNPKTPDIWIADKDHIEIEKLAYKPGQVFALSGAGNAEMIFIDPSKRETLADILFTQRGALNNLLARRSEVYLLRGKNPSVAYHLDAQNVSRILVAAKTELRPNDIVYVADRPIISFSRTLAEILPLRILLKDIQNDNIP